MAFSRYGKADTVRHDISSKIWRKVRVGSTSGTLTPTLVEQASEILQEKFNPERYLLSHCTIVCSVDTDPVPNVKLGKIQEGSATVNRKYADYRIKPECNKFINNNDDSWSRSVIAKSYRTFIGAHNFVEHVQLEELSKGRILDAVSRDIGGPSVYVDILVATARKHRELIGSIKREEMSTLSMGCSVLETTCTKCGHVAADETEMCSHIKYAKGNYFHDSFGTRHRIAELCGHETVDDTGGVTFIEASWVKIPAFPGAVLRNVIDIENLDLSQLKRAEEILRDPPKNWTSDYLSQIIKAASLVSAARFAQFDFGDPGGEDDGDDGEGEAEPDAFADLETEVTDFVLKRVKNQIKKNISKDDKPIPEPSTAGEPISPNQNLIREARDFSTVDIYKMGLDKLVRTASSDGQFIQSLVAFNHAFGVKVPRHIYKTSLRVGSTSRYKTLGQYVQTCKHFLGRMPSIEEARMLIRVGKLLSLRKHVQ